MAKHYHVYFATRSARRTWTDERFVFTVRQDAQRAAKRFRKADGTAPPWFTVRSCDGGVCPTGGSTVRPARTYLTPSGGEYQR